MISVGDLLLKIGESGLSNKNIAKAIDDNIVYLGDSWGYLNEFRKLSPLEFISPHDLTIDRSSPPGKVWLPIIIKTGDVINFKVCNNRDAWEINLIAADSIRYGFLVMFHDVPQIYDQLLTLRDSNNPKQETVFHDVPRTLCDSNKPKQETGEGLENVVTDPVTMVQALINQQVAAGGVDTEGTQAEAERRCAYWAECVCEGMRALTFKRCIGCEVKLLSGTICAYCENRLKGGVQAFAAYEVQAFGRYDYIGDIHRSSFEDTVTVDLVNGVPGIAFPIGTPHRPVNNFADAQIILNSYGFNKITIKNYSTWSGLAHGQSCKKK